MQIFCESLDRLRGVFSSIRWNGYEDLSGTDVDTSCMRLQIGRVLPALAVSLWPSGFIHFQLGRFFCFAERCHALLPFCFSQRPSRTVKSTLLKGINLGAQGCNHCMAHGTWDHASNRV